MPFMDNSNKKFPRAISAHVMRPLEKKMIISFIMSIFHQGKDQVIIMLLEKIINRVQKNKLNDIFDDNKKGNSSSQISTYEGINNSIYEKQNIPRHGFPYKNSH